MSIKSNKVVVSSIRYEVLEAGTTESDLTAGMVVTLDDGKYRKAKDTDANYPVFITDYPYLRGGDIRSTYDKDKDVVVGIILEDNAVYAVKVDGKKNFVKGQRVDISTTAAGKVVPTEKGRFFAEVDAKNTDIIYIRKG